MLGDVAGDPVEDLVELIAGEGGLELAVGQLQRQLEPAPVPAVDDGRERLGRSHQETRRRLEGPDRGREADPDRRSSRSRPEALERER